jgi:hypothetical protein
MFDESEGKNKKYEVRSTRDEKGRKESGKWKKEKTRKGEKSFSIEDQLNN